MKKNPLIVLAAVILIAVILPRATAHPKPAVTTRLYTSHYENVLGTSMELKVFATSPQKAQEAEKLVLDEIARLSSILSAYDPNSEFSKWLRTSARAVVLSH